MLEILFRQNQIIVYQDNQARDFVLVSHSECHGCCKLGIARLWIGCSNYISSQSYIEVSMLAFDSRFHHQVFTLETGKSGRLVTCGLPGFC